MRQRPLILIVDDEENFREIFSAKLTAAGFETVTANGEAEALQKSKELMPDLILMDIFMPPGPTGTDVALNIHQNPETKGLKIAFLTNLKDPWPALQGDHKNISQELGMEDFIEKTSDLDTVAEKVREILSRTDAVAPTVIGAPVQAEPVQPAVVPPQAPVQPVQEISQMSPEQVPPEQMSSGSQIQLESQNQPPAEPPAA